MLFRSASTHCESCPQQEECTPSPKKGRTVRRSEFDEEIERLKARMQKAESKELYKKRKQTVELGFADWKEHRRMRRFASRGREKAETQVGLVVLVHNLLIVQAQCDERLA